MPTTARSERRAAVVTVQTVIGAAFLGIWVLVNTIVTEFDLVSIIVPCIPYFICFECGVLSRYLPGVKTAARKFA